MSYDSGCSERISSVSPLVVALSKERILVTENLLPMALTTRKRGDRCCA